MIVSYIYISLLRFSLFHCQIDQVPLDAMHNIDGGVVLDFITRLFGLKKGMTKTVPASLLTKMNDRIKLWSYSMPKEMERRVRGFHAVHLWKMREAHHFITYLAVPLMLHFEKQLTNNSRVTRDFKLMTQQLSISISLLFGFSHMKPKQVNTGIFIFNTFGKFVGN